MEIFKHVMARIAGFSFDKLNFTSTGCADMSADLERRETLIRGRRALLSEKIHAFNQTLTDPRSQQEVQNLRKTIYQGRKLKQGDHAVMDQLPPSLAGELRSLLDEEAGLTNQLRLYYEQYGHTAQLEREGMRRVIDDETFLKGIGMSSHILYNDLQKYLLTKSEHLKSAMLHTERSLVKYLSRVAAKTSPFSTFTNLALAAAATENGSFVEVGALRPGQTVRGVARLNSQLFLLFKRTLFKYPPFYKHLRISVNSTCRKDDAVYKFLFNQGNIEFFKTMDSGGVPELLYEGITSGAIGTMEEALAFTEEEIEADRAAIAAYIFRCMEVGFLELHIGISELDPDWSGKLLTRLQTDGDICGRDDIQPVIALLCRLNELAGGFGSMSSETRYAALKGLHADALETMGRAISRSEGKPEAVLAKLPFKPESMIYEDTLRDVRLQLDQSALAMLGGKLLPLYEQLRLFEGKQTDKFKMFEFFRIKYQAGERVPLLRFYEDYYSAYKMAEERLKKQQQALVSRQEAELVKTLEQARHEKRDLLINQWRDTFLELLFAGQAPGADILLFDLELVRRVNTAAGIPVRPPKPASVGAFLQFGVQQAAGGNGCRYAVVNSMSMSYGKMHSRFLHLFPREVLADLRQHNLSFQREDSLFAEINDASMHNANVHPPLLPYEIKIPGGNMLLENGAQISVSDLEVSTDEEARELVLRHIVSGKRIYPFDLGFQAPIGRSELFRILTAFSYADYIGPGPLIHFINERVKDAARQAGNSGPVILPRIVYEQDLILQRKTWVVPYEQVPRGSSNKERADYFREVLRWRTGLGIPDHAFIRISERRNVAVPGKVGQDDYKPLYINFSSPLFVSLFERLVERGTGNLLIEEMLPAPEELIRIDGDPYVTEFLVQMKSYAQH